MSDQYCIACLQHKSEKHFTTWLNDKSKARRCNDCHSTEKMKERQRNCKLERKAKPAPVSPILTNLAKELSSSNKRSVRDKLYDLEEQKRLRDELEL